MLRYMHHCLHTFQFMHFKWCILNLCLWQACALVEMVSSQFLFDNVNRTHPIFLPPNVMGNEQHPTAVTFAPPTKCQLPPSNGLWYLTSALSTAPATSQLPPTACLWYLTPAISTVTQGQSKFVFTILISKSAEFWDIYRSIRPWVHFSIRSNKSLEPLVYPLHDSNCDTIL